MTLLLLGAPQQLVYPAQFPIYAASPLRCMILLDMALFDALLLDALLLVAVLPVAVASVPLGHMLGAPCVAAHPSKVAVHLPLPGGVSVSSGQPVAL